MKVDILVSFYSLWKRVIDVSSDRSNHWCIKGSTTQQPSRKRMEQVGFNPNIHKFSFHCEVMRALRRRALFSSILIMYRACDDMILACSGKSSIYMGFTCFLNSSPVPSYALCVVYDVLREALCVMKEKGLTVNCLDHFMCENSHGTL